MYVNPYISMQSLQNMSSLSLCQSLILLFTTSVQKGTCTLHNLQILASSPPPPPCVYVCFVSGMLHAEIYCKSQYYLHEPNITILEGHRCECTFETQSVNTQKGLARLGQTRQKLVNTLWAIQLERSSLKSVFYNVSI